MRQRRRAWAAWSIGSLVLAATAIAAGLRERDEGAVHAVTAALGGLLFALAVGALLRLAYVRLVVRRGTVASPWLLPIASVVALLSLLGTAGRQLDDVRDDVEQRGAKAGDCRHRMEGPFRPLPGSLGYRRLARQEEEALARILPAGVSAAIEVRLVADGGTPVGAVIAAPVGDDREAVERGFKDQAREPGVTLRRMRVDKGEAVYGRFAAGFVAAGVSGCDFVAVQAFDRPTLRLLAASLIADE